MANINLGGSISTTGVAILGSVTVPNTDANHTLTVAEYTNNYINVTGAITAQRDIIAPLTLGLSFVVANNTTGGFNIRFIGPSGTGVVIPSGTKSLVVSDGTNYTLTNSNAVSFTAGGDLSGSNTSQTVIKINGNAVSSTVLGASQDGYALTWVNGSSQYQAKPIPSSFTAGTDLSGTSTSQTVIAIRNNPITQQSLGFGQNGFALVWDGIDGYWKAANIDLNQAVGGDLGDFLPNPTVRKLWNVSIPQVLPSNPTATSGFIVGNILRITNTSANNQAMAYGPLNLGIGGSTTNATGILPAANQAPQNLTGDLSGFTNSSGSAWNTDTYGAVVTKLQKTPVQFVSMGTTQDGYVLTYDFTNNRWSPQPSTSGASLSGDVTGATGTNTLTKIQGINLVAPSPTNNQVLTFNVSLNRWEPQDHIILGDITGTLASSTVSKIRNNPVMAQVLGSAEDGYVFTWDNSSSVWKASVPASGTAPGGTAGGDLAGFYPSPSVVSINGTTVTASPAANTVLRASNSTTAAWGFITALNIATNTITDNNINSSAAIAGTKISPNFGVQNITTAGNITSTLGVITAQTFGVNNGSTVPTITSGTGVPATSQPDGSVFYRTDGTSVSAIYSRQSGVWVPVGAAAVGAAGGDLAGNYPNPSVIALQGFPVSNTTLNAAKDGYVLTWDFTGNNWIAKPTNIAGSAPTIYDEGVFVGTRFGIDFDGYGVTATDNPGLSRVNITIPGKGVQWFGSDMPFRNKLNFTGVGVAVLDDAANDRSIVTINGVTAYDHGTPLTGGRPVFDFDGYGVSVVDNGGLNKIVITVPGTAVSNSGTPLPFAPRLNFTTGITATYNGISNRIDIIAGASGAAGGDLSGTYPNPNVARINGNAVSPAILNSFQDGYVLTWVNGIGEYEAKPVPTFSLTIAGDLSGNNISQTVIKINGNPVSAIPNGAAEDGYVLTWSQFNGQYEAQPSSGSGFTASGDLAGTAFSQTVIAINGATVPAAGALTTGNGLYVTGASTLAYSGLNLAGGSNFVFGVLPTANQSNQTMLGDVTGTTGSSTVAKLRGVNISITAPSDGYVLTYDAISTDWEPKPPTSSSGVDFYEEGSFIANRPALNVIGGSATIVDDPGNNRVNLIITTSTSGTDHVDFNGYGIIQNGLAEVGQFINNARFKSTYDFLPISVLLDDSDGTATKDVSATPNAFSSDGYFQKNTFGDNVTFTLTADGYTDSFDVVWGQRNYYGTGPAGSNTAAFISKLGSTVGKTVESLFTVNAGPTEKIYFAHRSGYGTPQIFFNGFSGGFSTTYTVSVTNPYGFTENYTLYESDNLGLGMTSIEVY